ncbi:hypothetical protein [Peristeroidobacter agariperforans]|uniref:hypothetical protein n=1 Tax=Peristeroidobacter agariperforans TaxID=268404 RepID=UPI00101B7DC3|nr:hypothetical protein [Peristeroidobacter agariperforans]
MDRRAVVLALLSGSFISRFAHGSGHNAFCKYRDNGGRYLRDEHLLVYGAQYDQAVATVRRSDPPVTVLVESEAQYIRAINDIRRPGGPYPDNSIVIFDSTSAPEAALAALDKPLGSIRLYHSVPRSTAEVKAIHGDQYSSATIEAALPILRTTHAELTAAKSTDLSQVRSVSEYLSKEIAAASERDLLVVLGHRTFNGPTAELRFHDASSLSLESMLNAKPMVWVVSCDNWAVMAFREASSQLRFATSRPITYREGSDLLLRVRGSTSSRAAVRRIQEASPAAQSQAPAPAAKSLPAKPAPDKSGMQKEEHPAPDKPTESVHSFFAELAEPRVLVTEAAMVA